METEFNVCGVVLYFNQSNTVYLWQSVYLNLLLFYYFYKVWFYLQQNNEKSGNPVQKTLNFEKNWVCGWNRLNKVINLKFIY